MKRVLTYGIAVVLLAVAISCLAALGWLAGTSEGASWLMDQISRRSDIVISASRVEGSLLEGLRLENLRLHFDDEEIRAAGVRLRWRPLSLFFGKVAVRELDIHGMEITDNRPKIAKPFDLSWPKVTGIPAWMDVRVRVLRVTGFTYRRLNDRPTMIDRFSARVMWRDGVLTVEKLKLAMPTLSMEGDMLAGFRRPALLLKIRCKTRHPLAGADEFLVSSRLSAAGNNGQLSGPVEVISKSGSKQHLQIEGGLGLSRNTVALKKMALRQHGRRGTVNCDGILGFTETGKMIFDLQFGLADINLYPELHAAVSLGGIVSLKGSPDSYRGRFAVESKGKNWYRANLSGGFKGDTGTISFADLKGSLLDGQAWGDVRIDWRQGLLVSGKISGTNLNPAKINPSWKGVVNGDMGGSARWSEGKLVHADISGRFRESRFLNRSLTGEADIRLIKGNLLIDRLFARGKGFDVRASGDLAKRLAFAASVSELSGLVPDVAGAVRAEGWVSMSGGRVGGSVKARGSNLAARGVRIASADIDAGLSGDKGKYLNATVGFKGFKYHDLQIDKGNLAGRGSLERHTVEAAIFSPGFELRMTLSGRYAAKTWEGEIVRLAGHDPVGPWKLQSPTSLRIAPQSVSFARITLDGVEGERLEADGRITFNPLRGFVRADWRSLNLARIPWMPKGLDLQGRLSGSATGTFSPGMNLALSGNAELAHGLATWRKNGNQFRSVVDNAGISWNWEGVKTESGTGSGSIRTRSLTLNGRIEAAGTAVVDGRLIKVPQVSMRMDWNEDGMNNMLDVRFAEGGTLSGRFFSLLPSRKAFPNEGEIEAEWQGFDLSLVRPWLPAGLDLEGRVAGQMKGKLLTGNRLQLKGTSSLSGGRVRMLKNGRQFAADVRSADLSWDWAENGLGGEFATVLADYGSIGAKFHLPLAAHFPIVLNEQAPMVVDITGKVRETGLLTSLFPGLIQETQGELSLSARLDGKLREPVISGNIELAKAGAYLPTAGIRLKDVRMNASFDRDRISITSLNIASGSGRIEGKGVVRLKGWQVEGYQGTVKGERFQTVYLPELQVLTSPDLSFTGSTDTLTVRGNISVPELLVSGQSTRATVQPSSDVVLRGEAKPAEKKFPLALDIQVGVTLGDRVRVKAEGIDAQLQGKLNLLIRKLDEIRSTGEIRVVKGKYKTYGINLDITKGRIYYAGGPINQPTLDIQASRKVGDVKAGVAIVGTPRTMVVKLYSEPPMPDSVIMSYIVLGQPVAYTNEQSGLLEQASGKLLPAYTERKGISGGISGAATSKTQASTLPQSMITIGRYLTPELYISYGRSLLNDSNLVRLRYALSKKWEIETQTGSESGGDIYFKINFK